MSKYIGNIPVPQATQTRTRIVATSGQTTFTTSDSYTPGYIDVFLGGVKLDSSEFTATNGTTVVLASGANAGQIFESISYTTFSNAVTTATSANGPFTLENYTTSQRDALTGMQSGDIIYNTTTKVVEYYSGTAWYRVNALTPTLVSITGSIVAGITSDLTLAGTNFLTTNLVVNFLQSSDSIDVDVTVTPTSQTAATVTVPSSVYSNVTAGNVVTITVTNADGIESNGVNTTAVALPTGGTEVTSNGYRYHTYTSSGNFVVPTGVSVSAQYIIIAGGAAGGGSVGGGGGAGGHQYTTGTVTAGTHAIVVGAGGAQSNSNQVGNSGSNSSFNSTTSLGGGGGGYETAGGASGGSGGGGGGKTLGAGAGTSGQGYAGGDGGNWSYGGGGGGGAGGAASSASGSAYGTAGGAGDTTYSTWYEATSTGEEVSGTWHIASGGGGADFVNNGISTANQTATPGGGGRGANYYATNSSNPSGLTFTDAAANTGGGGGGLYTNYNSTTYSGGNGGSGLVIIRYAL